MKALAVVLLSAAVLLDKSPPVASSESLELTDVILKTLDLDRVPQKSKENFDVPRYIMALYTTKARTGRLRSNDREIIRTFFRDGKTEVMSVFSVVFCLVLLVARKTKRSLVCPTIGKYTHVDIEVRTIT